MKASISVALVSMRGRWVRSFGGWPSSWGLKYAYATTSGITALHPALKAPGVGPGDEVITTPFTFAASATVVLHTDAVPIFADIDHETLNLDSASVESEITDMTKAVVVAHLAGHPPDLKTASMSQSARGCRPGLYTSLADGLPHSQHGAEVSTRNRLRRRRSSWPHEIRRGLAPSPAFREPRPRQFCQPCYTSRNP
jgi:hypothetical protein